MRFDEKRREVRLLLRGAKVIAGPMRDFEVEQPELVVNVPPPMDRSRLKFQSSEELFALLFRGRSTVEVAGAPQPLLRAYSQDDVEGRIQERFAKNGLGQAPQLVCPPDCPNGEVVFFLREP